ncbi:MAG TPA: glycosyltransferase [Solirubrobacterales bacterium]
MSGAGPEQRRILFVSSNGTGLGHLTRSMAIARRLREGFEPLFVSLSAAAPIVAEQGFEVEYIASHATPTAGSDWRWSRRLRARMRAILRETRPSVVVFDGAHPYQGFVDALAAASGAARVWSRRPMWLPGSNAGALGRERFFTHVLEPGEFAAEYDRGATVARRGEAHAVEPIVFCEDDELLPREQAERELGLEPGRTSVLVALGQGAEVRGAVARCLAALAGRGDVQVAALSSALAELEDVPEGVAHLRSTYPMSRYLRAFDAAVSAAGYNAYHELIRFGVPTLYVPMERRTDDQAARARYAADAGVGLAVSGPDAPELEARLAELLDEGRRAELRERLATRRPKNGAEEAARWIEALAAREREGGGGGSRRARSARLSWATLREAPRMTAAIAYQTALRPAARTLVLAPGVDAERLAAEVRALLAAGERPERTLVVIDSLEALGPLRALGVGIEHVPGAGSRAAALSGLEWPEFFAARLGAILAERPRPRRVVELGERVPPGTLNAL